MTFSVKKGSIHGFLGPNGSGKSTTMNLICGLLVPNSGEILIGGKKIETDITVEGPQLMKKKIFYDEVMKQAAVFLPFMKEMDFEKMMIAKFQARTKATDYDPE